uniref:Photosystem II protein L n=1 Tax=Panagrolaimus sp. ES5 TaxID=591445 RepID=A0AC34FCU3_9BILA
MFARFFSIIFGSLVGTVIILSVIYEYGLEVEDAIRYTLIVLGGVSALSIIITVCFTCFVKSFGYDDEPKKENSFSYLGNGINPVYVLSFDDKKQQQQSPPLSIDIPSVVVNPNYLSSQK